MQIKIRLWSVTRFTLGALLMLPLTSWSQSNYGLTDAESRLLSQIAERSDISRTEMAQALINYEASARLKEYQLNEEKMFMPAPGSHGSITAGEAIGALQSDVLSKDLANEAISRGLPIGKARGFGSRIELFESVKGYFKPDGGGNPVDLAGMNMANLLQSEVMAQKDADQLIDVITNPFASPLDVASMIDPVSGEVKREHQEKLAERVVEQAALSVPISALSELAAKRIDQGDNVGSTIQLMAQQSKFRFTNPQWYGAIGSASSEAILREIAHMQAYNIWVQYQQYRMDEQMVALTATLVASQAKLAGALAKMTEQMAMMDNQAKDISSDIKDSFGDQNDD